MQQNKIYHGEALKILKTFPDESIDCVITSPPYWNLRNYHVQGQLGLESNFNDYIEKLLNIFDEIKRVLKKEGTCWINLGDTYYGNSRYSNNGRAGFNKKDGNINQLIGRKTKILSNKSLCMIPERFAIDMITRGWILRNEIIWRKPNAMPSSVKDRFTVDFEKIYFFTKSKKYYFKQQREPHKKCSLIRNKYGRNDVGFKEGVSFGREVKPGELLHPDGRNKRSVWNINTKCLRENHFAIFPEKLVEIPLKAGCPLNGVVLDPFIGSGTTAIVAKKNFINYIGIELNKKYIKIANKRIKNTKVSIPLNKWFENNKHL